MLHPVPRIDSLVDENIKLEPSQGALPEVRLCSHLPREGAGACAWLPQERERCERELVQATVC